MNQSALDKWKRRVSSHHAQSHSVMEVPVQSDFWASSSYRFKDDPYRLDDLVLNAIQGLIGEANSVLDVGGGAGRYAMPISLRSRSVTVLDQSEAMLKMLRNQVKYYNIPYIKIVHGSFEDILFSGADVVLCAHVLYTVETIDTFIARLNSVSRHKIIIVMFEKSPQSELTEIWKFVHGNCRITLPGATELLDVLKSIGIKGVGLKRILLKPNYYLSLEDAFKIICEKIFIQPESLKGRRLSKGLGNYMDYIDNRYVVKGSGGQLVSIISWEVSQEKSNGSYVGIVDPLFQT